MDAAHVVSINTAIEVDRNQLEIIMKIMQGMQDQLVGQEMPGSLDWRIVKVEVSRLGEFTVWCL